MFFELLRVAIGTQDSLSTLPTEEEWEELYAIAKKQSLVGITFVGLKNLGADPDPSTNSGQAQEEEELYARIGMSEDLYFTWAGVAAKISVQNELVNQQCLTLQKKVSEAGFASSILKGQAVGNYYQELKAFRQPGDIDALLWPLGDNCKDLSLSERRKQIVGFARSLTPKAKAFYHHVDVEVFTDTAVELHYTPSWFFCPWTNRKFQKWVNENRDELFCEKSGMIMPSVEFNLVYILTHIYQHLFQEGVGLRQLMDYYFVLRAKGFKGSKSFPSTSSGQAPFQEAAKTIESLGMKRFAGGVMWIMQHVFGMTDDLLLCSPDAKEGAFLLNEVMQAGNFGKYDERINRNKGASALQLYIRHIKRNLTFLTHYPSEVLWAPFWKLWHMTWIRTL